MAAHSIKLFALSTCVHCRHTKEYLDSLGVDYVCVHVDQLSGQERQDCVEEVRKHNPAVSFPTMVVDDKEVVVGFKKDVIDKLLER